MPKRERGEGRVYVRGRIWWVQYSHRGQVYRVSAKSEDRKVAVRLLRKKLSELYTGRAPAPSADKVTLVNLRKLIEDDHRANRRRATRPVPRAFRHLDAFFGEQARAVDITPAKLAAYRAARDNEGAAPATIAYELGILSRCFNLAIEQELLQYKPPFPKIRLQNARKGWVSDADVAELLKELPDAIRPVVRFCYITGWRVRSEVLTLCWSQVSSDAIRLEPGTTKSGEGREWPLAAHPELARLIEQQRAYTEAVQRRTGQIVPWVFHREGRPIRSMKGAWQRACERAGLKLIPHDLRRSAVRNLERAGVPRSVAMKLVGHQTEAIYRRYAIVAPQDLAEGVSKLAALHGSSAVPARSAVLPLRATEG
jgi:site-specific recombinase XerD